MSSKPERRPLTPEQWETLRRRWEGSSRDGFDWLAKEARQAWGRSPSRQGLSDMAKRKGWEKGGAPSEPLAQVAGELAQVGGELAQVLDPDDEPERGPEATEARFDRPGVGRPTKYRPEFAQQILTYFDKQPYTEVDVPQPSGLVKRQRMATDPPMLSDFARSIGVSVKTLNRWAVDINVETGNPKHPDFVEAYARAREMQESLIARGGLLHLYDPRVAQFALKNLAGWADQPARTSEVAPISKEELEATYIKDIEEAHATQDKLDAERRQWLLSTEGGD